MTESSSNLQNAKVSVTRLDTYEPAAVEEALERLLDPLGGMGAFVNPGSQTILKPNFLSAKTVERTVCTHPEIIRTTARIARKAGAPEVIVTDSPAVVSARQCARKLGLKGEEPFTVIEADDGMEFAKPGGQFHRLTLSKRMVEADPLINLAKAKTHGQTVITAAVKNCFGAVVGMEKAQWHFRIGADPMAFARLLNHIHSLVKPRLNIIDAVVGMEGNGPGSGDPRKFGFLLASTDAHALDAILCKILGLGPQDVFTLAAAQEEGLLGPVDDIEVVGASVDELKIKEPLKMARPSPANRLVGSEGISRFADRMMSVKPAVDQKKCTACGQCAQVCAAEAITIHKKSKQTKQRMTIDDKKCISCFCCQEICPEGAISVKAGLGARILGIGTRK